MKKITLLIAALFLFVVCANAWTPFTLRFPVLDDANEIHVYAGEDISATAGDASTGDVIYIHPGSYTESGATFSTRVKFVGFGNQQVVWTADSNLWTLGCDSIEFENIYFEATRDGQLGVVSTYDWFATNCTFDCSTFTPASDAGNFVQWTAVEVRCRKSGGFEISDGDVYTDEYFHCGVPLGIAGTYYGMVISGDGLFHAADKVNIYASDSVRAAIEMTSGDCALQEGGLVGNKMNNDKCVGIRLDGDAVLAINGGDIQSNSADSATIVVRTTASIDLDRTKITNKEASTETVYISTSSTASSIQNCLTDGIIIPGTGATDIIWSNISPDDLNMGGATPSLTFYDTDNETGASIDTSGITIEADGEPSIEFVSSDGDVASIVITIADQLAITGATSFAMNCPAIVNGSVNYAADAQEDDDYEVAIPGISALTAGLTVTFKANTANTGAATLEITAIGDLDAILKQHDVALANNDIEAGQIVVVVFDGTNWQMTSQIAN